MKRKQDIWTANRDARSSSENRYNNSQDRIQHTPSQPTLKFELRNQFQRDVLKSIHRNHITALIGSAGSGKTLLAAYGAMQLLHAHKIKKIIVVRLARESHLESIGALPGSIQDKLGYISAPIYDNLELMTSRVAIDKLVSDGVLEISPLSYLRGRSLHDTYVIVEEVQNIPPSALLTILTRLGANTKIVLTGDPQQEDFNPYKSCTWLGKVLDGVDDCRAFYMPSTEAHRHPIIPQILANAAGLV